MTSCSTAAVITGLCRPDADIEVYNRGGMVRCRCHIDGDDITTRLSGNATYEWLGRAVWDRPPPRARRGAAGGGGGGSYESFARRTAAKYPHATCL